MGDFMENISVGSERRHQTIKKKSFLDKVWNQKDLFLLTLPFVIYILTFNYAPLIGWVMAFQKFRPAKGYFD